MEKELYNKYLNEMKKLNNYTDRWVKDSNSWVADYILESNRYTSALRKLSTTVYTILSSSIDNKTLTDIIYEIHCKCAYYNFTYSAYRFVIKIISDLFDKSIDVSLDSIDDNFEMGDNLVEILNTLSPDEKKLMYYKNKLLDFSKSNQLVDFKMYNRSCIGLSYPSNESLISLLLKGEKIYLEHWETLKLDQISQCTSCGKQFIRKFTQSTMNLGTECPNCDTNKKTKHAKPIKEMPIIANKGLITLTCPNCNKNLTININNIDEVHCSECDSLIPIPSYPIIDTTNIKNILKNNCICNANDVVTQKAANLLQKRAKNLEINFGLHSLYLACGFLKWTTKGQDYNSPLLMVKINIMLDKSKGKYYFILDQTDDDAISLNYTLQKMLQNYSKEICIELPSKREGQTYEDYKIDLEYKLKQYPVTSNWEIKDNAAIGVFHYQKLQLEKELNDNFDTYLKHPVLRSLIGLDSGLPQTILSNNNDDCSVLDADSSQEAVIKAANEGKSFILQGPPGTGKSQTISNVIANALGQGKTVLFVTEKATARNIIWDNLNQCKLTDNFKLTDYIFNTNSISHGNSKKTDKLSKESIKNFINEKGLVKYYNYQKNLNDDSKEYIDKQITDLYDELNTNYGHYTLREWIHLWSKYCDFKDIDYISDKLVTLDNSDLKLIEQNIKLFYNLTAPFGLNYKKSELFGYKESNISLPSYPLINELNQKAKELKEIYDEINNYSKFTFPYKYSEWIKCSQIISKWTHFPEDILKCVILKNKTPINKISTLKNEIKKMYDYALNRKEKLQEIIKNSLYPYEDLITNDFDKNIFDNNTVIAFSQYSNIFKRLSKQYKINKNNIIKSYKNMNPKASYLECYETCKKLRDIKALKAKEDEYKSQFVNDKKYFFEYTNDWNTDWDDLIVKLEKALDIIQFDDSNVSLEMYLYIISQLSSNNNDYKGLDDKCMILSKTIDIINNILLKMENYFDRYLLSNIKDSLDALTICTNNIIKNSSKLVEWSKLQNFLNKIGEDSIYYKVINVLISEDIQTVDQSIGILYKNYYKEKIYSIMENEASHFGNLNRTDYELLIKDFTNIDTLNIKNNANKLYNYLNTEKAKIMGAKQNEKIIKSVKGVAVKKVIKENWDKIKKVTPCFMMSPLNVGQYLDISLEFDLVIFDEASQIFLEDSLASVIRGKQVIISGDRHQLPPCNFFKASDLNEEIDENYDEEVEIINPSILDATLYSDLDEISLKWHYRSNDESLIYFSNNKFYNNSLITFPTAKRNEDLKLIHHYVKDSVYGNGKQHINAKEADEIVQLLWEEIQCKERRNFTLGVVAFNVAQAYEIEERWLKFVESDPVVSQTVKEWEAMEIHQKDPIIFCNLDTIQGDERDTMIISTTYSENKDGKFSLMFLGPVRQKGGSNRINVAITRAKQRMIVVTSLTSSQIKHELNKSEGTCNDGAEVLCDFLDYAERENIKSKQNVNEYTNEFINSICKELNKNNIHYDLNVGLSTCKIDIAIKKDPTATEYVLGIITDDNGLNNKSVREYARLYDQVLQNKYSWDLYHIWLEPWFLDHESEKNKLIELIKNKIN